jgi:hypothetical protein
MKLRQYNLSGFFNVWQPRCACRTRNNKDAVRRDTTFIVPNPKQLHVSAAQSSNHPVDVPENVKRKLNSCSHTYIHIIIQFTASQRRNSTSVTKIRLLMGNYRCLLWNSQRGKKWNFLFLQQVVHKFIVITGHLTVKYAEELFRMKVTDLEYCIVF